MTIVEKCRLRPETQTKFKYYDKYLDMEIEVTKLPYRKIAKYFNKFTEGTDNVDIACELIYECVEQMQDKELQEMYDIKLKPYTVVLKVYEDNIGAIMSIGTFIINLYGADGEDTRKK